MAMSNEPLTNAAVAFIRSRNHFYNSCVEAPTAADHPLTEDFTMDDRRSGGINYGLIDASGWPLFFGSAWDLGEGHPHLSSPRVIAVRGERCAATVGVLEFGSGLRNEFIICHCLDPELRRWQRMVVFDVDDVDGSVAELDRMYAEIA